MSASRSKPGRAGTCPALFASRAGQSPEPAPQSPNCISSRTLNPNAGKPDRFPAQTGKKKSWSRPKISPKFKQSVCSFVSVAGFWPVFGQQEMLRLEKSADAMGRPISVVLYGADRVQMEAAADAAFDEVRRLDRRCCRITGRKANGARSTGKRPSGR